jgi:hypothetical protein
VIVGSKRGDRFVRARGAQGRFTPLKSEPLLRVLIADLVGAEVTRDTIGTLRADLADLRDRLDDATQTAEELSHRHDQLLLVIAFLRELLDLHDRLVDDVERLFSADEDDPAPTPGASTQANDSSSVTS